MSVHVSVKALVRVAGPRHTATTLEAAQALASILPSAARLTMTSTCSIACAPSPNRSSRQSETRGPASLGSSEAAKQSTFALLRTAASELGGRIHVAILTAEDSQPRRIVSSATPGATSTGLHDQGIFTAKSITAGATTQPRLTRGTDLTPDTELCQIRSLRPGSLSSLTAVTLLRCERIFMHTATGQTA